MKHQIYKDISEYAHKEKALQAQRFFKTGKGEYGEGDVFIGLTVPECRSVSKKYFDLEYSVISDLLESQIHEHRLIALHIMVLRFTKNRDERKAIFDLYISHLDRVNNWDLVDASAYHILGEYSKLIRDTKTINTLVSSKVHFHRRAAVVATFAYIKAGDDTLTYTLAEQCMKDKEDLMHKAVGWMLRECGKRVSKENLRVFLDKWAGSMPRTMLRYSLEHFDEPERRKYMVMKDQ
jgi:3-methyladenine DNA glycosylase AlkD